MADVQDRSLAVDRGLAVECRPVEGRSSAEGQLLPECVDCRNSSPAVGDMVAEILVLVRESLAQVAGSPLLGVVELVARMLDHSQRTGMRMAGEVVQKVADKLVTAIAWEFEAV